MSQTTFSLMSDPDLLLTIKAYTLAEQRIERRIAEIDRMQISEPDLDRERNCYKDQLSRYAQLSEAIIVEYDKRERS